MDSQRKDPSLGHLFSIFFRIGAFTFGGGYAMLPIMQRELVDEQGWLKEEDFVDMIGLTQSAPGPVAVNSAIYLGYRLKGIGGAISSVIGVTLPSLLTILAIAWALTRYDLEILSHAFAGVRPAVVSLIAYAAWTLGKKVVKSPLTLALAIAATAFMVFLNMHPAILILTGAILGLSYDQLRREGKQA